MPTLVVDAIIGFTSAKAGAAGTTPIQGARNAGETPSPVVRGVDGETGPQAEKVTYEEITLAIETPSWTTQLAHLAKTGNEIVVIDYDAEDGPHHTTYAMCAPIGIGQVTFPDKAEAGYEPRTALLWLLLEGGGNTLRENIDDLSGASV